MSNVHYDVFLKSVFSLTATLTIKSEQTAQALNSYLALRGYPVDELKPITWKYYMNMAGRYHASDREMRVRSSDTGEDIVFSVENLQDHLTTKNDHVYGTEKFRELVSRYPDQRELILGILNPVDINVAIGANDHSILHYDKSLVEVQENNLIPRLQIWIDSVFRRWYVSNFNLYADLHEATFLAILYSQIPQQILNIREDNCNTELAHSYHIREYLDSFGDLGKYFDYMTWKQKLFFYRNLRFLNTNSGRWGTFDLLTERVFTDRRFPLTEFTIEQNAENIQEDLTPTVEMIRRSINGYKSEIGSDIQSVRDVLTLEDGLATRNIQVKDDFELSIINDVRRSKHSSLMTKVLESSMIDRSGTGGMSIEDVVVNHWPYLASLNRYNSLVTAIHPVTGEDIPMSTWDAFLVYMYAYSQASRKPLEYIPVIGCWCVRRVPMPTKLELRKYVEESVVPDYFLDEALRDQPDLKPVISSISFLELCNKIHEKYLLHEDLYRYQDDMYVNGQVEQMVGRFYHNYDIEPAEETLFADWLSARNLDFSMLNEDQFYDLAMSIYAKATGYTADTTKKLSEIHSAHVRMMAQLSTYSVQFVHNSNSDELVELRWKMIRPGNSDVYTEGYDRGVFNPITILTAKGLTYGNVDYPFRSLELFNEQVWTEHTSEVNISIVAFDQVVTSSSENLKMPMLTGTVVPLEKTDLGQIPESTEVIGYDLPVLEPLAALFTQTASPHYEPLSPSDVSTLRART